MRAGSTARLSTRSPVASGWRARTPPRTAVWLSPAPAAVGASASLAIRAIPSRPRPAPWTRSSAPATAAARAGDSPSPEPSGTRHCVTTRTPVFTPIASRTRPTVVEAPFRSASETSSPSTLRSVSFDSIHTPATPVSTRHQGLRSMATVTPIAPGRPAREIHPARGRALGRVRGRRAVRFVHS